VKLGEFRERRQGKSETGGEVVGHCAEEGERLERGLVDEKFDESRVVVYSKFKVTELEGSAFQDPVWWGNN
jgi:hypothetical protein